MYILKQNIMLRDWTYLFGFTATLVPFGNPVTFEPVFTTMPENSCPRVTGILEASAKSPCINAICVKMAKALPKPILQKSA